MPIFQCLACALVIYSFKTAFYAAEFDLVCNSQFPRHANSGLAIGPIRCTSDGDRLFFAYGGTIWQLSRPFRLDTARRIGKHDGDVIFIAVNSNDRLLHSTGFDGKIRTWSITTQTQMASTGEVGTHYGLLDIWPDRNTLATRDSRTGVTFRDPSTLRITGRAVFGRDLLRALSPVTDEGCFESFGSGRRQIQLIDRNTDRACWAAPLMGYFQGGSWFSPDGRFLAINSTDHGIELRERVSGKLAIRTMALRNLERKHGEEWAGSEIAFPDPLGTVIVTSDREHRYVNVYCAYAPSRSRQLAIPCDAISSLCAVDPYTVAVGTKDGKLGFIHLDRRIYQQFSGNQPYANLATPEAVEQYLHGATDRDHQGAYSIVPALVSKPGPTVAALKNQLRPPTAIDRTKVNEYLRQLGHERFAVREKAEAELSALGEQILPIVLEYEAGTTDQQVLAVINQIKGKLVKYTPDHVAFSRACHLLALIGTPDAVSLLKELAAGPANDRRTRDAKQTLAVIAYRK